MNDIPDEIVEQHEIELHGETYELDYWPNEKIFDKIVASGTHLSLTEVALLSTDDKLQLVDKIIQITTNNVT